MSNPSTSSLSEKPPGNGAVQTGGNTGAHITVMGAGGAFVGTGSVGVTNGIGGALVSGGAPASHAGGGITVDGSGGAITGGVVTGGASNTGGGAGTGVTGVVHSGGLQISADGRRLEQGSEPLFWMADTMYMIFHSASHADVVKALDARKAQGFNVVKAYDNVNGNFTSQLVTADGFNESYIHDHIDFVVDEVEKRDLYLLIVFHESSPVELSRFLMNRYKARSHILYWVLRNEMSDWISGVQDIIGRGSLLGSYIYEGDQSAPWREVYTAVGAGDAARLYALEPAKPVLMADGMYDRDDGTGYDDLDGGPVAFERTPLGIRRGAYVTFTHGGFFTYGHPVNYSFDPGWEGALNFESVGYLTRFKSYWTARSWWKLVPDGNRASNVSSDDDTVKNHLGVLRSTDNDALYVYYPGAGSATISLNGLAGSTVSASWTDPRDGTVRSGETYAVGSSPTISVPPGFQDALLELIVH